MSNKIIQIVEIDFDFCTLEWGVGDCTAEFGLGVVRKCHNTYTTCPVKSLFNIGTKTLWFIEPSYAVKGGNYIPALVSVDGYEQEVNIAGFSSTTVGLGKRANITVKFRDFPSRDTLTDKYFAGRMDGTAQTNEAGYDPIDRGSFWTKFKSRVPNYASRALRIIQAHINDAGDIVEDYTRHYVIDSMDGPDSGTVTITAKDILALADDTKALAPATNQGVLAADISATDVVLYLSPSGIGDSEYPASGFATIGSEIVWFTRSSDTLSIARAQKGTTAATHSTDDTVQVAYNVDRIRADNVIYELLTEYGNIPTSYIDFAEWQAEFNRWGANMYLSATICKATGVSTLISEINQLGITVWWDEIAQKVRIKLNHPPDVLPVEWSDRNNIISIEVDDNDDERATRVEMLTVQEDPTKALNTDNFLRTYKNISVDSESPYLYGISKTETIYCRWLNHGADYAVKIITGRLLNRYKRAPATYTVVVDVKDNPKLTDVISLSTHIATDVTGLITPKLTQVYYRVDKRNGSTVTAKLQAFQFDARYGVIAENDRPLYTASSAEQKLKGSYFVGPTLLFADGGNAYQFA